MTLARARETGWAYDREEYETNVHCVAAPIFGAGGRLIAAISLAAHRSSEFTPEQIAKLCGVAQSISAAMGASIGERIKGKGYGDA